MIENKRRFFRMASTPDATTLNLLVSKFAFAGSALSSACADTIRAYQGRGWGAFSSNVFGRAFGFAHSLPIADGGSDIAFSIPIARTERVTDKPCSLCKGNAGAHACPLCFQGREIVFDTHGLEMALASLEVLLEFLSITDSGPPAAGAFQAMQLRINAYAKPFSISGRISPYGAQGIRSLTREDGMAIAEVMRLAYRMMLPSSVTAHDDHSFHAGGPPLGDLLLSGPEDAFAVVCDMTTYSGATLRGRAETPEALLMLLAGIARLDEAIRTRTHEASA